MNFKSVAFHHFGCKVNFAEASALSRKFRDAGVQLRDFHQEADVYVISTCVVTAVAEKKCRAAIRQAHKLNPAARIAVIGCFSELKPGELQLMEGVDLVLGHSAKFRLFEELESLDHGTDARGAGLSHDHDYHGGSLPETHAGRDVFVPSFSYGDRTRSFLKIQDGCDYYCTYCTIPLARGRSRSDTVENAVNNAREIIRNGIREIILTGVNIGDFGRQNGENFLQLIRELDRLEGISRIRISSIEPDLLTDAIIEYIAASKNFLPHFHLPLQSGCNRTLKAMHRKYDRELYRGRVLKIRSLMPRACIAADVIVGFPGETDEDFGETRDFIDNLDISYLHVFTYSKRDNTLAAKIPAAVHDHVKKERSDTLHRLSEEKKRLFYLRNSGTEARVLFESDNSNGFMHGFTENYVRVRTEYNAALVNQVVDVRLEELSEGEFHIKFG
jgi:threonylcarbamoyladenosine tRNA methylthiotransferase MtaB